MKHIDLLTLLFYSSVKGGGIYEVPSTPCGELVEPLQERVRVRAK